MKSRVDRKKEEKPNPKGMNAAFERMREDGRTEPLKWVEESQNRRLKFLPK